MISKIFTSQGKHDLKVFLAGCIGMALFGGASFGINQTSYSHHKAYPIHTTQISASSSLYQSVRRNDLYLLHKVDNKEAHEANLQHALIMNKSHEHYNPDYYLKRDVLYHPDKHGNYWSYFENHPTQLNDNFDFGRTSKQTSGGGGLISSDSSTRSGIIANEKVLRNHGVHSGVNFVFFDKNADDN